MFYSSDPTTELAASRANAAAPGTAADGKAAGTAPHSEEDRELQVLSIVHEAQPQDGSASTHLSQRSIAQALGMSVGLTNAILKRLADKGFVMMRRINHNNVHYLVTPEGIDQISRRSYHYLRRTIGHVVRYKERLREFCRTQRDHGIREIVLIGESDLTFILEWCAEKEGIGFRQVAEGTGEGIHKVEPEGPAKPTGSEFGPQQHRVGGEIDQPAHAGVVYLLSELHPEPPSDELGAAIPLHEIVLGNR